MGTSKAITPLDTAVAQVNALAAKSAAGDAKALARVQAICDECPELFRQMGDRELQVRGLLYEAVAGKNTVLQDAIATHAQRLRRTLCDPAPHPIERVLIDRVVIDWLHLQVAEHDWLGKRGQGLTLSQADYYQRTLDRAQGRYLKSLKKLAQVRRLRLPALQINIGARQVNVAG